MPCTCNSICDNDCSSNQLCTGHVPACVNTYSLTTISVGTIVRASHVWELHTAIDGERNNGSRRYNASEPAYCSTHTPGDLACTNNDFSSYPWSVGIVPNREIEAQHYDELKDAINEMVNDSGYGSLVTANFIAQSVCAADSIIKAVDVTQLQTRINQSRNVCICDSHCNCDPSDCGCNGECPSDDYYYYYYP